MVMLPYRVDFASGRVSYQRGYLVQFSLGQFYPIPPLLPYCRWGGMISTPDAVLQAMIKRSLQESGCPVHIGGTQDAQWSHCTLHTAH